MFASGLGIFPAWQYSGDPAVNSKINPHVVYPDGMTQTTVQPVGPYYTGPEGQLGYTRARAIISRRTLGASTGILATLQANWTWVLGGLAALGLGYYALKKTKR